MLGARPSRVGQAPRAIASIGLALDDGLSSTAVVGRGLGPHHDRTRGARNDPLMGDREELVRRLRDAGRAESDLIEAEHDARLATLAVETALGGGDKHTLTHVARIARLRPEFVRELMQAMGRPSPRPRQRVFTDDDVEVARVFRRFLDAGLPRHELLEVGRVLSQGMANTAEAVRRVVGNAMLRPGDSEYTLALRYAEAADQLAPLVPSLLDSQFRAHLRSGIRGQLITEAEREAGRLAGAREVAVAFADLVNYTRVGERLAPEDVGRIAGRLSQLSAAAASAEVQLVKMIGDAAMFVSPTAPPVVQTGISLIQHIHDEGAAFPDVRVGLAPGPATPRGGDWFGRPVNLANRVTDVAKPGTLLATESIHDQAPDLAWKRRRSRRLKGVDGRVRLFSIEP
jgi:adenylate cyclase